MKAKHLVRELFSVGAAALISAFATVESVALSYPKFAETVQITSDASLRDMTDVRVADIKDGIIFGHKLTDGTTYCPNASSMKYSAPFLIINGTEYELDSCHDAHIEVCGNDVFYSAAQEKGDTKFFILSLLDGSSKKISSINNEPVYFGNVKFCKGFIAADAIRPAGGRLTKYGNVVINTSGAVIKLLRGKALEGSLSENGRITYKSKETNENLYDLWDGKVAFGGKPYPAEIEVFDLAAGKQIAKIKTEDGIANLSYEGNIAYTTGHGIEVFNPITGKSTEITKDAEKLEDPQHVLEKLTGTYKVIDTNNYFPDAGERYIVFYSVTHTETNHVTLQRHKTEHSWDHEIVVYDTKTGKKYSIEVLPYSWELHQTYKIRPRVSSSTVVWTENRKIYAASPDGIEPVRQIRPVSEFAGQ